MKLATATMMAAYILLLCSSLLTQEVGGRACFFTPSTTFTNGMISPNYNIKIQQYSVRRGMVSNLFDKMANRGTTKASQWRQKSINHHQRLIFFNQKRKYPQVTTLTMAAASDNNEEETTIIDETEKERLLNEIKLLTDSFGNVQEKIRTNAKIYEERISYYESKIEEMEEMNGRIILQLKDENEELKAEIEDVQTNSSHEITMERKDRLEMEQLLNEAQDEHTKIQAKYNVMLKKQDDLQKQLETRKEIYKKERARLSSQITELKQNRTCLQNELHHLNMQRVEETNAHGLLLGNVTQHLSELLVKEANWTKAKDNLLVRIGKVEQELDDVQNEKKKLMGEKSELEREVAELTTQNELEKKNMTLRIHKLEEIVSDLKSKKDALKTQLDAETKSHEQKLVDAKSKLAKATTENDGLKKEKQTLTQKLKNKRTERDTLQKKIDSLTSNIDDIQWTYKMAQKQNQMEKATLSSRIVDLQHNVANLTQEVDTLVDDRVKESKTHAIKLEKLTKELDDMTDERVLWLSERDTLLKEKAQLENEKKDLSKERDHALDLRNDVERSLKANKSEHEKERKKMLVKITQLEEDTTKLTGNMDDLEAQWKTDITKSESKLDKVTHELSTALNRQADWQSEKDSLIQEREKLQLKVENMAKEKNDLVGSIDKSMETMEKSLKEVYSRRNEETKISFEKQIKKLEEKNMDMAREIIELMTQLRQQQKDPVSSRHDHHTVSDRNGQHEPTESSDVNKKSVASYNNSKPLSDIEGQIRNGKNTDKNVHVGSTKNGRSNDNVVVEVDAKSDRETRWKEKVESERESEWEDELENNIPLMDAIFCGYKATEEEKSRLKSAHLDDTEQS